jgi:hypothetical protein
MLHTTEKGPIKKETNHTNQNYATWTSSFMVKLQWNGGHGKQE